MTDAPGKLTPAPAVVAQDPPAVSDAAPESANAPANEERGQRTFPPLPRIEPVAKDGATQGTATQHKGTDAPASEPAKAPKRLSDAQLKRHGLRRIEGKHLELITDVPAQPKVEELPAVFEAALPQWCKYFDVTPEKMDSWRVTACLMKNDKPFRELGLLPDGLPEFRNGYATSGRIWFYEQKSDYYRRHLLLHEGTHAFMYEVFGSCGPTWYMEGMAELLGTHRWQDGQLTLGYFPKRKQEVPLLGRIRMVRDEVAAGRARTLHSIMAYDGRAYFRDKVPYGWSWAVCAFLDSHPRYFSRFRSLPDAIDDDLSTEFRQTMNRDWRELNDEWAVFIRELVHGHDLKRSAIEFDKGESLPAEGITMAMAADRGWQSSTVHVEQGRQYRITAAGRYQITDEPEVWWCEPGGVTIRYHKGHPLGMLLAGLRPEFAEEVNDNEAESRLGKVLVPQAIGLGATWTAPASGTLYFRINESAAGLADNAGTLQVEIQ